MTGNRIWKEMTIEVGKVTKQQALYYSFMVVMLRGSRIVWDLRKVAPYNNYDEVRCLGSLIWELETDGGV